MHPGRRRLPGYGLLLLAYQVFGVVGINYIPPVTLALVGFQSAIYLRLFQLPWYKASQACVSLYNVWYRKEYKRLLYAAFEHGDDWHLYYNMASFIIKGQLLEKLFGSPKFLYLTFIFSILTNMTLIGLSFLVGEFYDSDYGNHCAVGFSGVIFALKVLTTYYDPNYTHQIMGIPVMIPANYAVWAELFLIQLIVPNASFLGHLAGIIVGLAYIKGPLGPILDFVYSSISSIINPPTIHIRPQARPSGYRVQPQRFSQFSPEGMDEEEQLRRATEASLQEIFPRRPESNQSSIPNIDEIRQRRLARLPN